MATWKDVSRLALALPEAEEGTTSGGHNRAWTVRQKLFVWERPLRKSDLVALGDAAPDGNSDGGDGGPAGCGNGVLEAGEACDLGARNADTGPCTSRCAG